MKTDKITEQHRIAIETINEILKEEYGYTQKEIDQLTKKENTK